MRRTAFVACCVAALTVFSATMANAYAHRRVQDVATPNAPIATGNGNAGDRTGTSFVSFTGLEAPSYAYGYVLGLPSDSNWRWIEERCYGSRTGQLCVDGHWVAQAARSLRGSVQPRDPPWQLSAHGPRRSSQRLSALMSLEACPDPT